MKISKITLVTCSLLYSLSSFAAAYSIKLTPIEFINNSKVSNYLQFSRSSNNNTILAYDIKGAPSKLGLWRSDDNGSSWYYDKSNQNDWDQILLSKGAPDSGGAVGIDGDKLYFSSNIQTWANDSGSSCNQMLHGHSESNALYATNNKDNRLFISMIEQNGSIGETLVSSDFGQNCVKSNLGAGAWNISSSEDGKVTIASFDYHVKLSTDGGKNWSDVKFNQEDLPYAVGIDLKFSFDPQNSQNIYAVDTDTINDAPYEKTLWFSHNGGLTWNKTTYPDVKFASAVMVVNNGKDLLFVNHFNHFSTVSTNTADRSVSDVDLTNQHIANSKKMMWFIQAPSSSNNNAIFTAINTDDSGNISSTNFNADLS
ncbi:hypothetical protein SOPP22_09110 [Shewanella sp. OPT22]|nr:hypothetical protein SOPP22_09110 [Shewanella sp. OPT22]